MRSKSLAARTRDAVRDEPFLFDALRAGVLNYSAAARYLPVEGEARRHRDRPATLRGRTRRVRTGPADVRVSMKSGIGPAAGAEPILAVGGVGFAAEGGGSTAIVGSGSVDAGVLRRVLGRLETAGIDVEAAGVTEGRAGRRRRTAGRGRRDSGRRSGRRRLRSPSPTPNDSRPFDGLKRPDRLFVH